MIWTDEEEGSVLESGRWHLKGDLNEVREGATPSSSTAEVALSACDQQKDPTG